MKSDLVADREQFLKSVFPAGIPRLWCPPVTHYNSDGSIDEARIAQHYRHLVPTVGGLLIPGSTGDGWELTKAERRQVLTIGLRLAQKLNFQVLIGALHPETKEAVELIREDVTWLQSLTGEKDVLKALVRAHVCGFTICAQRGRELSQQEIHASLSLILELGLPTAIYQLPQVTLNEISPDLASDLARTYENFLFFKDTSGTDAVVLAGKDLRGVFTARGAEGDYARWLKLGGGFYDGFLLSSANCFARELHQVAAQISAGGLEDARELSQRISTVIKEVFHLAGALPHGNAFANGNKAIDHFFAHGPEATNKPPPRLHAGSSLPLDLIRATGEILRREKLMPVRGYLEPLSKL